MKIIILLGKSGCGKGTQAELLSKKFSLAYIGSGNLLRERALKKDFTGKKLSEVMAEGGLVPTPVVSKIWLDEVEIIKNRKNLLGLVMDGNPRKMLEAYLIDEALNWYGWDKYVIAVNIRISDKEAIWRLTKRRICKKCGEIIPFLGKFKNINKCPECNGELIERNDDKRRPIWNFSSFNG